MLADQLISARKSGISRFYRDYGMMLHRLAPRFQTDIVRAKASDIRVVLRDCSSSQGPSSVAKKVVKVKSKGS